METVAWIGALETAIGLLYLAIVGQRSIAQWLDDHRRKRMASANSTSKQTDEPKARMSSPPLRSRPRLLSIQSIGAYFEYVWRDPTEAALVTSKALTLGGTLIFGTATLLLVLSALVLEVVVFFNSSRELDGMAQHMATAAFNAFLLTLFSVFLAVFAIMGSLALAEARESERKQRELDAQREAQRQATAERRRATQK